MNAVERKGKALRFLVINNAADESDTDSVDPIVKILERYRTHNKDAWTNPFTHTRDARIMTREAALPSAKAVITCDADTTAQSKSKYALPDAKPPIDVICIHYSALRIEKGSTTTTTSTLSTSETAAACMDDRVVFTYAVNYGSQLKIDQGATCTEHISDFHAVVVSGGEGGGWYGVAGAASRAAALLAAESESDYVPLEFNSKLYIRDKLALSSSPSHDISGRPGSPNRSSRPTSPSRGSSRPSSPTRSRGSSRPNSAKASSKPNSESSSRPGSAKRIDSPPRSRSSRSNIISATASVSVEQLPDEENPMQALCPFYQWMLTTEIPCFGISLAHHLQSALRGKPLLNDPYHSQAEHGNSHVIIVKEDPIFVGLGVQVALASEGDRDRDGDGDYKNQYTSPSSASLNNSNGTFTRERVVKKKKNGCIGAKMMVRQDHVAVLEDLPDNFELLASSDICPLQMMRDRSKKIFYTTQFLPQHHNAQLLFNFITLVENPPLFSAMEQIEKDKRDKILAEERVKRAAAVALEAKRAAKRKIAAEKGIEYREEEEGEVEINDAKSDMFVTAE